MSSSPLGSLHLRGEERETRRERDSVLLGVIMGMNITSECSSDFIIARR